MNSRFVSTGGRRRPLILIGGLLVIGAAMAIRWNSGGPTPAAADSAPGGAVQGAEMVAPTIRRPAPIVVDWPLEPIRDLFDADRVFPATGPVSSGNPNATENYRQTILKLARTKLHLSGTIQTDQPLAMINGAMHGVGDTVDEFRIRQIGTGEIVVERQGIEVRITAR